MNSHVFHCSTFTQSCKKHTNLLDCVFIIFTTIVKVGTLQSLRTLMCIKDSSYTKRHRHAGRQSDGELALHTVGSLCNATVIMTSTQAVQTPK